MDEVNLNLLKYFYEVVNYGNITKASERLFVSQPAITKSIKELEKQLGISLLIRSKTGVTPTAEGEILYSNIKEIFSELDSTFNIIERMNRHKTLYIGTTTTNFFEFILKELNIFKEKNPNVFMDIKIDSMVNLQARGKLKKLDIVIKHDYENIDGFNKISSYEINDRFVASRKAYGHLENKKLSLDEILSEPFVLLSEKSHGRQNLNTYLKTKNKTLKPKYEFDSHSLCRQFIKNGFGIGIGNPIHYKDKDFIILDTEFDIPVRKFEIGYLANSDNPIIKNFKDLLKKDIH